MDEARLDDTGSGLAPSTEGWFVVNVRDAEWKEHDVFGSGCVFESDKNWFPQLGIDISVLEPGKPNCLYHSESLQEAFLVLSGECRLLVNGEERLLGPWDFFHCPAGVEHVFVGAGDVAVRRPHGRSPNRGGGVLTWYRSSQRGTARARRSRRRSREWPTQPSNRPLPGRPSYWDHFPGPQ